MKRIIKVSAFCIGLGLFAVGCGSANQTEQKNYPSMQQNVPAQNNQLNQRNNQLNQRNNQMNRPQQQIPRPQPTPTRNGGMNGGSISH